MIPAPRRVDPHAGRRLRTRVTSIHLFLTTACNLRCAYCHQDRRSGTTMPWRTLRAVLDWAQEHAERPIQIIASGGEPLLALPLLRQAIEYASRRLEGDSPPEWVLQTNGELLDPAALEFLAEHGFAIHLSCDGIPAAQRFRDRGASSRLHDFLDSLSCGDPQPLGDRLTVLMTVIPETIEDLADSFSYLVEKSVSSISISPAFAPDGWSTERFDELGRQFEQIAERSLGHYRRTGGIPFIPFRTECARRPPPWYPVSMCGVTGGQTMAVDVDGSVYGCAMLVDGASAQASPWLRAELARLRIGHIDDTDLRTAMDAFVAKAHESEILANKRGKRSDAARCAICPAISECDLCPVSIGLVPGNDDPNRVPDFGCAFHLAAFRAKQQFRDSLGAICCRTESAERAALSESHSLLMTRTVARQPESPAS
jgi:sulfatase maturation enzyme AslB (radical SAM superfamily)